MKLEDAIGDLSKADKEHLKRLAETHTRILEAGVGASTQILTHFTKGEVMAYDTSKEWLYRIRDTVFPKVGVIGKCNFRYYDVGTTKLTGRYDLTFVDIEWAFRLEFALKAWPLIVPGGKLVMHDARRSKDIGNALQFAATKYREIEAIEICPNDTNLIVFIKRDKRADFVNWHKEERMSKEQLGIDWEWKK